MYTKINRIKQFDFQINRVLTYGKDAADESLVRQKLADVKNIGEWYEAWISVAHEEEKRNEALHASYAYRMAEFFLESTDERKGETLSRCLECFSRGFEQRNICFERFKIPYEKSEMKCFYFRCDNPRDTIVICGGYDSFIEEFVLQVYDFSLRGYDVILFEGPGQGECIKHGLYFTHAFEKPLGAVLDYLSVKSCIMLGISWGGYFALRSAAFDKRIHKAVAYDVLTDGYGVMTHLLPPYLRLVIGLLVKRGSKEKLEGLCSRISGKSIMASWMFSQGKYITGTDSFLDMYKSLALHNVSSFHREVTCDLLLLSGEKDHYIPKKQFRQCRRLFPNARSVKYRMFTKREGGEQHCQIGNHRIAIEEILSWL